MKETMTAHETKELVMTVVDMHSERARKSQYDIGVAINAVACARQTVLELPVESIEEDDYGQSVIAALTTLRHGYNDTDGQYTNGKGVLGSLIDDLYLAFSKR